MTNVENGWQRVRDNSLRLLWALLMVSTLISCQQKSEGTADKGELPLVIIDTAYSADSVPIYYEVHGSGDTALVFLHGWGIHGGFWEKQVEAFDDSFKVVVLDFAGHGRSGSNRADWSSPAYAADVNAVLDAAEINQAILIAHSMGGVFAAEAAVAKPERVIAIIGADTYQDFREKWTEEQAKEFLAPFHANFDSSVAIFASMLLPPNADSSLVNRITTEMQAGDPQARLETLQKLFLYDATELYRNLRVPVRAVNADTYPTQVDSNRTLVPLFDVKIMQGVGHFPFLERPEEFNRLLAETIGELRAGK